MDSLITGSAVSRLRVEQYSRRPSKSKCIDLRGASYDRKEVLSCLRWVNTSLPIGYGFLRHVTDHNGSDGFIGIASVTLPRGVSNICRDDLSPDTRRALRNTE